MRKQEITTSLVARLGAMLQGIMVRISEETKETFLFLDVINEIKYIGNTVRAPINADENLTANIVLPNKKRKGIAV